MNVLQSSIKEVKGIGPKKALIFEKLGVKTLNDLLYSFPRDYENRNNVKTISALVDGETALVIANIQIVRKSRYILGKKSTLRVLAEDKTGAMEVIFFNGGYLEKTLKSGVEYNFFGKVSIIGGRVQMIHPSCEISDVGSKGILPIYPLSEIIRQSDRRKIVKETLKIVGEIEEYLPDETIKRNRLCDINYALSNIHFPEDERKQKVAGYRLVFEELLNLQMGLSLLKNRLCYKHKGISFDSQKSIVPFLQKIPFALTNAQVRTIKEILEDMESSKVMNRLVQGDVGSGKTIVAAAAVYKAFLCGYQSVLMVPTEILARQHFSTMKGLLEPLGINIGFLSGGIGAKERKAVLADLAEGKIDLLIGTHALIQPEVSFRALGLAITDEQHRFGVNQRELLSEKGNYPDVLVMTATPIPRTLALVLYGDLDISSIDEMPPGRKEIKTIAFNEKSRSSAYSLVREELKKGRQVYIVAPLIEDSETLNARSAEGIYSEICSYPFDYKPALLHGGLKQKEKDEIMNKFENGEIRTLVSTVVIEVGINVPNAAVIVIENAERFGLAQMHQLRGRIGRGEHQSYCLLISSFDTQIAKDRAKVMLDSADGFVIAEKDLTLRGPGEFFGTRQHGIPELKIADLVRHSKILSEVQKETKIILSDDPDLNKSKNQKFSDHIEQWFQR